MAIGPVGASRADSAASAAGTAVASGATGPASVERMAEFTIPGLVEFADINMAFLELQENDPSALLDSVRITSVYGGFPGAKFCGGRNSFGPCMDLGRVRALLDRYSSMGVACNLTYTNQLVDEKALSQSSYSIALLGVLARSSVDGVGRDAETGRGAVEGAVGGTASAVECCTRNGVILHSDALADYVEREYPTLARISSTTKLLDTVEKVDAELSCFDRAVLDYGFTRDRESIAAISHPERVEVMVNEYCTPGCPRRAEHYKHISLDQVRGYSTPFVCAFAEARPPQAIGFMHGLLEGDVFLRNQKVREYRDELGVRFFKIVGRGLSRYDVVDSYLYYLVKPEHWYEMRDMLIHSGCL